MSAKTRILLVEDDPNLGVLLSEYLNAKDYDTTLCTDGQEGYDTFMKESYDFVILDVMMPVKDGFTVAEEIRQVDKNIPILFLTAKAMKEDTLKGFKVGADDYMTKPFSMEELMARVEAILRRSGGSSGSVFEEYTVGKYTFNPLQQILKIGDSEQRLTTKENDLLHILCKNKNNIVERSYALNRIWGNDNYFNGRSMDVYITKLRKYLNEDDSIEIINVHGKGFKLID
jgi:two-component system, OmpR family, response regulator